MTSHVFSRSVLGAVSFPLQSPLRRARAALPRGLTSESTSPGAIACSTRTSRAGPPATETMAAPTPSPDHDERTTLQPPARKPCATAGSAPKSLAPAPMQHTPA